MAATPVPEGYHTAAPYLVARDAARAIEFYTQVFGATECLRLQGPDGRLAHAEIRIGDSIIMIADEAPDWGALAPPSIGGSPVRIHLYVPDVDAVAEKAVAAGARILIPIGDQFYGDRSGRIEDPFGHVWIVATHKEDMPPAEMQRRFEEFMKRQAGA